MSKEAHTPIILSLLQNSKIPKILIPLKYWQERKNYLEVLFPHF